MQEIEKFEEGEPMIDGEPGDLKVEMLDCFQRTFTGHEDQYKAVGLLIEVEVA